MLKLRSGIRKRIKRCVGYLLKADIYSNSVNINITPSQEPTATTPHNTRWWLLPEIDVVGLVAGATFVLSQLAIERATHLIFTSHVFKWRSLPSLLG